MYGFASLWFSIGIIRIFFYFSDYLLEGTYTGNIETIFQKNNLLHLLIYYLYEYAYIYLFINITSLCLIFIWFSIKLKAEFKSISSIMAIGFAIFLIGWAFEAPTSRTLGLISPGISSALIFIGILIAILPLVLNLEFFYKPIANWIVLALIISILLFLGLSSFTNLPLSLMSVILILISTLVLAIVIIYMILQVIRRMRAPIDSLGEESTELKDFLKIFTKPNTITKEEIHFSIEKKVCLVCKSKISRLNYMCPECEVLYCTRCSNLLKNSENACWVCETPFDKKKIEKKG